MTLKTREGQTTLVKAQRGEMFDMLGAEFTELSDEKRKEFDLSAGVEVSRVYPGVLRQEGIRNGFIITRIDNQPIRSLGDLEEVLEDKQGGGVLIEGIYPDAPEDPQFYGVGLK
jgi:S1-C subfamily serine protease